MAGAAAAAAVIGTGVSVYGQIKGAQAQADAQRREADIKGQQADEIESREASNIVALQHTEVLNERSFGASFASTGREGGGIGGQLEMRRQNDLQIANMNRDAAFKARMLRAGADVDTRLASDTMTSAYISSAGTVLGTASGFATSAANRPAGKTENL